MAVSRAYRVLLVTFVTLTLTGGAAGFLWGNSAEDATEDAQSETSEEIWDKLESEEKAVASKVDAIKEKTAKVTTEDLVAMDKDLDADIERDAYSIALAAAEDVDDSAESAEEEEEEAEEEIDSVMEKLISDDKKAPTEEKEHSSSETEAVAEPEKKTETPKEKKSKVLPAEPGMQGDQALGDRRYYPHNSRSYRPQGSGLATTNNKYFDIRPLEDYMKTCDNCYEHVGNNICPMHQPALELKKWALELEEVLSHGCMKPENCDKPGTCCLARMDPFEPTIVRMTQMLKDTFMTVQKNCDKCRVVEWSEWQAWTQCSATCGVGSQMRTRSCDSSANKRSNCEGPSTENRQCFSQPCCGDSQWSDWCAWSECSGDCGGKKTRTRSCIAQRGCPADDCDGDRIEEIPCGPEVVNGNWGSWAPWVESGTCGRISKTRSRLCNNPPPNRCGSTCPGRSDDSAMEELQPCSCQSTRYSMWSQWSGCSATCGSGQQTRSRGCEEYTVNLNRGRTCPTEECTAPDRYSFRSDPDYEETKTCNMQPCCGDWQWSSWTMGSCSASCGVASRSKSRECQNVRPGPYCPSEPFQCDRNRSPMTQNEQCAFVPCPEPCIEREWTMWSQWSRCPVTCGGAEQERTRSCEVITGVRECPNTRRSRCPGPARDTQNCGMTPCPKCRETQWTSWERWGSCNCDTLKKTRSRKCNIVIEGIECANRGPMCDPYRNRGIETQDQDCRDPSCCEQKQWDMWSQWSSCPLTCRDQFTRQPAVQTRNRQCRTIKQGLDCGRTDCNGRAREEKDCSRNLPVCEPCQVSTWASWTRWDRCNCDTKTQSRTRTCEVVSPGRDGFECRESMSCDPRYDRIQTDDQACDDPSCCVDAVWTSWAEWGDCEHQCGEEEVTRRRVCDRSRKTACGRDCVGSAEENKMRRCGPPAVYGRFGQWQAWSACSATCGIGDRSRIRVCDVDANEVARNPCARPCAGNALETGTCDAGDCCEVKSWTSWETWSQCTETCVTRGQPNRATRTRSRLCRTVLPGKKCRTRDEMCPGMPEEQVSCTRLPNCPSRRPEYDYGRWEDWCPCDCKTGKESRRRSCFQVDPTTRLPSVEVDLSYCQNLGVPREERDCDISRASCPACKTSCRDERGNPLRDGDYPSCSSCANYISCTDGRAQEFKCDVNGQVLEWDSYVRKCVSPPSASCSLHEPVTSCRDKPNRSRHHSDRGCTYYVECNNGQVLQRECRGGREFDAHTQKCKAGRSWTCTRQFINYNRAVIGGRRVDIRPNDAPADMFYTGNLNSTERRLAYEKKMKEKHDDELTAAKNAERVRLGLDPSPANKTSVEIKEKYVRRMNPECVDSCANTPAGHYGSCRACNAYVICTRHGHLRERRCHGGKEFDAAKRKCVTKSQTCVLKGLLTDGTDGA